MTSCMARIIQHSSCLCPPVMVKDPLLHLKKVSGLTMDLKKKLTDPQNENKGFDHILRQKGNVAALKNQKDTVKGHLTRGGWSWLLLQLQRRQTYVHNTPSVLRILGYFELYADHNFLCFFCRQTKRLPLLHLSPKIDVLTFIRCSSKSF